ncbi:Uncharacterised protein [Leminorella richardii]|uniref:Uncharacterized protein n=1 Tax=Leminorella richardii TaxID=158841 RepID=A0A2X4UNN5_9GAMM|nr:hypothetical protein [Leminorella richardii]SQI40149.1 Uncharacterised protein [Leminorella richardii]
MVEHIPAVAGVFSLEPPKNTKKAAFHHSMNAAFIDYLLTTY